MYLFYQSLWALLQGLAVGAPLRSYNSPNKVSLAKKLYDNVAEVFNINGANFEPVEAA